MGFLRTIFPDRKLQLLQTLERKLDMVAIDTSRIKADVAQQRTVNASIIALLNSVIAQNREIAKQLANAIANGDPEAIAQAQADLDAVATDLEHSQADIAAAVTQNTPAAEPAGVQTNEPAPAAAAAPAADSAAALQADTSKE